MSACWHCFERRGCRTDLLMRNLPLTAELMSASGTTETYWSRRKKSATWGSADENRDHFPIHICEQTLAKIAGSSYCDPKRT